MAKAFIRDEDLCQRYAQFASDLDRWHFKILYWFMFVLNLVILFIASWTYTKYTIPLLYMQLFRSIRANYILIQNPRNKRGIQSPATKAVAESDQIHAHVSSLCSSFSCCGDYGSLCALGSAILRRRESHFPLLVNLDHDPSWVTDRDDGHHPCHGTFIAKQKTPVSILTISRSCIAKC